MVTFETATDEADGPPQSAPAQLDLLRSMLDATGRRGVPIRRAFVQAEQPGEDNTRRGPLASLIDDPAALNAYLLIHALASSSAPYDVGFQSSAWVTVAGLNRYAEMDAAKSRWARQTTRLVKLGLIKREGSGRRVRYLLLHESGDGSPYMRPKTAADGNWFALPHEYWLAGHEEKLSTAQKVMLLIALDSKPGFELAYNRAPTWYGVSESTAKRGLSQLANAGYLDTTQRYVPDARSRTLWRTVIEYTPAGIWSLPSRRAIMRTRQTRTPAFSGSDQ